MSISVEAAERGGNDPHHHGHSTGIELGLGGVTLSPGELAWVSGSSNALLLNEGLELGGVHIHSNSQMRRHLMRASSGTVLYC